MKQLTSDDAGWFLKARIKWARKRLRQFRLSNHFRYSEVSSSIEMSRQLGVNLEGTEFAIIKPIEFEQAFWLARKMWLQDLVRSRSSNTRPHLLFQYRKK